MEWIGRCWHRFWCFALISCLISIISTCTVLKNSIDPDEKLSDDEKSNFHHTNSNIRSTKRYARELFKMGKDIAISTDSEYASKAAFEAYLEGGNVVDALIRASFVLAVVRPQSTGIGGGGFALIRLNNELVALDFRERAPLASHANIYLTDSKQASVFGAKSIATPGMVAGLLGMQARYAKLSLVENLAPAISLAENGFIIYKSLAIAISKFYSSMNSQMQKVFSTSGARRRFLQSGERLYQKDLAKTLVSIRDSGRSTFYNGFITDKILQSLQSYNENLLQYQDFQSYQVKERKPILKKIGRFEIATMPLPSSGTYILEMLEKIINKKYGARCATIWQSSEKNFCQETILTAMKEGFQSRATLGGDPDFSSSRLLIDKDTSSQNSRETTHISIMDQYGNAAVSTQSINYLFGSRIMAEDTGIIFNGTMDDFARSTGQPNVYGLVGGHANAIASQKTPLSSMSPTFVFENQKLRLGIGAMGGSFIISAILQILVNDLLLQYHPYDSVAEKRLHYQVDPNIIWTEKIFSLSDMNHGFGQRRKKILISKHYAKAFLVRKMGSNLFSVVDPRSDGYAIAR